MKSETNYCIKEDNYLTFEELSYDRMYLMICVSSKNVQYIVVRTGTEIRILKPLNKGCGYWDKDVDSRRYKFYPLPAGTTVTLTQD